MQLIELISYLDDLLQAKAFKDYAPNGLQVQGKPEIKKIITGVTASQRLIDAAVEAGADAILVHHGWFWKGEAPTITGQKFNRLKPLIDNGISLIGYHLPMDAHPALGNNAGLQAVLGLTHEQFIQPVLEDCGVGQIGHGDYTVASLAAKLESELQFKPIVTEPLTDKPVKRIAWCTGGAMSYLQNAIDMGADAFITGEINEPTAHLAQEYGVAYYAAGHHATERFGPQLIGEHLAKEFNLDVQFIDCPIPV